MRKFCSSLSAYDTGQHHPFLRAVSFATFAAVTLMLAILFVSAPASADGVTYDFSGSLSTGGSVSGQFTLNDTTGQISSFDFTSPFSAAGITSPDYRPIVQTFVGGGPLSYPGEDFTLVEFFGPFDQNFLVLWFADPLSSFDGGPIWTSALPAGLFYNGGPDLEDYAPSYLQCEGTPGPNLCQDPVLQDFFASGSAVPTPEPSSLILLACGIFVFLARRRKRADSPTDPSGSRECETSS